MDDLNGWFGKSIYGANNADEALPDDVSIRQWSSRLSRFLLTCDKDYYQDGETHPLRECSGIIILAKNDKPRAMLKIVSMLAHVIRQLIEHIPWDWWRGARIKVGADECTLWKEDAEGNRVEIALRVDQDGLLHFKIK